MPKAPRLALLVFAATTLLSSLASALELPELAAQAGPSVVLLTVMGPTGATLGMGTGFFISPSGRIVTNHHVIDGASRVVATLSDGRKVEVTGLLADAPDDDLAVAQAEGGPYPVLPLATTPPRQGEEIAVLGSPRGLSGSLSVGIVSALRDPKQMADEGHPAAWKLQITAPISAGSSGSPVMTRAGEVVGVAVGVNTAGQNLNFAVPVAQLKELLGRTPEGAKPAAFGYAPSSKASSMGRNLAISAATVGGLGLLAFALLHHEERKNKTR